MRRERWAFVSGVVSAVLDARTSGRGRVLVDATIVDDTVACGIYTHHQRRSNPNQYGVNVACLSGLSPFDFEDVVVYDGANHPEDAYFSKPRVAGHLKFITEAAEKLIDIPEPDSFGG